MYRTQIKIFGNALIDDLILGAIALFAISLFSGYQINILEGSPVTIQTLLILWFPLVLGWRIGGVVTILYLIIGGLGMPVFANSTFGWEYFTGSMGGYLLALPVAAIICGGVAEKASNSILFSKHSFITGGIILFLSHYLIHFLGLNWQSALENFPVNWVEAFRLLMPKILVKTALGTIAFILLGRIITRSVEIKNR